MSENKQGGRPGGARRGQMGGHGPMGGGFGGPVEKPKNFKGTLKRLLKYLKPYTVTLVIVFIFTIGSTALTVYAPMRTRDAMNSLQQSLEAKGVLSALTKAEQSPQAQMGLKMMNIPILDDSMTNDQKADAINQTLTIIHNLPADKQQAMMQSITGQATNGQAANASLMGFDVSKITDQQISDLTNYVRQTGGRIDFELMGRVALQLLALFLLSAAFLFVMQYMMSGVSQKTIRTMRTDVNDKLARLPLKFFDDRTHGEILSRMTNDMDSIAQTLQQNLTQVISSIVSIIGYIIMMLTISPILTLIVMATLPLYIVATMFIAKASQKYYTAQQKHLGELSGHVEEMYGGHKVVKAFGHEEESIEKFMGINDKLYVVGWKAQFMSGIMFPIMNFISNLGYVIICVIGGAYAAKKTLQLGDITTFIQYSRSFTQPIVQTANIANVIQSTIACAERVFELLDEAEQLPDKADAVKLEHLEGAVSFNDVRFG